MKYVFLSLIVVACSSGPTQLTDKAKTLELYATKPQDCRVMGRVVGIDNSGSKELALNHAMNQAAELKASGIFVNQEVPNGSSMNIHATAYACD